MAIHWRHLAAKPCCATASLRPAVWLAVVALTALATELVGQPTAMAADPAAPAAAERPAALRDKSGYRKLAPGIEITIPTDVKEEETFSVHDLIEVAQGIPNLKWTPKLSPASKTLRDMATGTVFRSRSIWALEFTFKPVRMMWVDIPQPSGKMQRKLVWYMIYHVKNNGGHLVPQKQPDGTYQVVKQDSEVRFFPQFVLGATEEKKAYLDRLMPVAVEAIQKKEDPRRQLLNSVDISIKPIPVSTEREDRSVWGVATWVDLDPRIDFFNVSIQGLSNAYKWVDPPGGFKQGDPPGQGRVFLQKTLVLNFWRPGDEFLEEERVIHYGIPGKVDYSWVYR